MLAASLALAIGLAIYDLTAREIDLSSSATQSQYAIYAADTGAECALYWDAKYTSSGNNNNGGSNSAFSTSSADTLAPATGASISCNGQDVSTQGPPSIDLNINGSRYPGCATSPWCVLPSLDGSAATTTFSINIPSGVGTVTYCAVVQVGKYTDPTGILYTTVTSRGYNTCSSGPTRFERTLQVSY